MAFINKIGNLLKHSAIKHTQTTTPAMYQLMRWMSSSKLFVGGISYSTDDMSLRETFARYGEVVDAKVILDRETGRSRGFGFVTFTSTEDASSAIQGMDGQDLHGRRIRVNYATERSRPGFGGAGGFYGGGGYAGSNYGGDNNRSESYGSSGYGGRSGYGGSSVNSDFYGSGSGNYGVPGGAGSTNYQFQENSGGDTGFASSEFSSNSGSKYDDSQFGSDQNDETSPDDGALDPEAFEDNPREKQQ